MSTDSSPISAVRAHTALYGVLLPQKDALISRWVEIVHGTYPFDTVGFLRTLKDRFANPVGYRTEEAAKTLAEIMFTETPDIEAMQKAAEEIIRVRAIQDFPPEAAVGVFFAMKQLVRDALDKSGQTAQALPALLELESRIDAVVLMAFGAYARCRETLHQMKVDEFKRKHSQILRLAEKKAGNSDKADTNN